MTKMGKTTQTSIIFITTMSRMNIEQAQHFIIKVKKSRERQLKIIKRALFALLTNKRGFNNKVD